MNKLWVFGDSFSELYDSETSKYYWSQDYLKWKGYTPKNYTQIMSEELGCELVNISLSATNNYQIFQDFCDNVSNISPNDYVIIQWTEYHRFRLVNNEDKWDGFTAHTKWSKYKLEKFPDISYETVLEIIVNRKHEHYKNEVCSWEKLIRTVIPSDKLLIWYPFDMVAYNGMFVKSIETIKDETKGEIVDLHFSENGNIQLSKILLDKLLGDTNKKII